LIERAGLPVVAPRMPAQRWFDLMRVDKKAEAGSVRYVLIDRPGSAALRAVDDATVQRVIERHTAAA